MNSSLRDQLLAAGLVTEKQARQAAQQEQQRQFRDRSRPDTGQRPGSNPGAAPKGASRNNGAGQQGKGPAQAQQAPSVKAQTQHAQAAKVARDQELNRQREDKA